MLNFIWHGQGHMTYFFKFWPHWPFRHWSSSCGLATTLDALHTYSPLCIVHHMAIPTAGRVHTNNHGVNSYLVEYSHGRPSA